MINVDTIQWEMEQEEQLNKMHNMKRNQSILRIDSQ